MKSEDFRAQLEEEFEWRSTEVRHFHNLCEECVTDDEKKQFRRAVVLLLYSHFEGYCKFALSLYASAINGSGLKCREANFAIAAASLDDVFLKLRHGSGKAPEFRNSLPDDTKLHQFARDREFIERTSEIMDRPVQIPETVVNTESNLKPAVLRKNLYKLGLPYDQFESLEPSISKLLEVRNKIAHGESRAGIERPLYESLRDSALGVMTGITSGVTQAWDEKWFLAPGKN